jgi:uncharacterized damage-inducible protein DinB
MTQQTMTEKEMFLQNFEREYQTTLKVLRAFPAAKGELKAAENMKTAREIAWMLAINQMVPGAVIAGALDPSAFPPPPATFDQVVAGFEKAHHEIMPKLKAMSESDWNAMINMPVGPKQMADMRKGDAQWFFLSDTVHHRGQFSVYMRIAGAKLPSIYGPTADEPWW